MATVPVRPPRFLGEKVPMREQTVQERIQEQLGSGYTVTSTDGGYKATAQPVKYLRKKDRRTKIVRRGQEYQYSHYVPHEIHISSEGEVQREIKRGTFKKDATGKIKEWGVYDSEVTDYDKQTRFTYGKRDMKSGRQSIRETSRQVAGEYKETKLIHQDSKEYQKGKRTEEQARLIREKGFTVRNTEEYAVAGMTKGQRREYYRLKAQQRSAQLSMDAKAQKIARQETQKFREELSQESQRYATDIVEKQKSQRPKAPDVWVKSTPPPEGAGPSVSGFTPPTPASPTTRTGMQDKPFLVGGKLPPGELVVVERSPKQKFLAEKVKRGGIPGFFYSTYLVASESGKIQDTLSFKASRSRAGGRPLAGYTYTAGLFAFSVPVGAVKMVKAVATDPINTVGAMFNPESYRQAGVQLRERPAKFTGELTGALLVSYGVGKGIQKIRSEWAKAKPRPGESAISKPKVEKPEYQSRFPKEGRGVDIVKKPEMKFLKKKTGKGQIESTVFSAKRVVDKKGRVIETPAITKVRTEITGKPSKIGTIYGEQPGKPVKVDKTIQTEFIKPKIIARSKWMPGDVREVVVVHGKPYIPDWTGGKLRPYRPGEFTLETVYPGGGLHPSQKATVGHQRLSYVKKVDTPYGRVVIDKKPTAGVQATLYPKEIVIKKVSPPSAPQPKPPTVKPLDTSVKTTKSPKVVDSGPGTQLITKVKPKKYAPVGEVLHGTLKTQPVYQVSPGPTAPPKTKLPETGDLTPKTRPVGPVAVVGLSQFPQQQQPVLQQPTQITAPDVGVIPGTQPKIKAVPSVDVLPGSMAVSKAEAKARGKVEVVPDTVLEPVTRTTTRTETRLETELKSDLLTEQITRTTQKTKPTTPAEVVGDEPIPPPFYVLRVPPKEAKRKKGRYQVEVREKGVFKKIKVAESVEEAFKFGEKRVKETASASLRVKPVAGGKAVTDIGRSILPKKIFRESKKEPGVFIQRRQYRISSPGEKKEITHKGLRALKIKSVFKKR